MKRLIIVLTILLASTTCYAKHKHPERWYQDRWAKGHSGITEYRLKDGKRVDILTEQYAIEVDFAKKFYQAVGQSLLYAARTGKQPGIILVVETERDEKYIDNLQEIIDYWKLPVRVWVVK